MKGNLLTLALAASLAVAAATSFADQAQDDQYISGCAGTWAGPDNGQCLTLPELSKVQPGLGTIMVEVSYRNWVIPYAALGGNWDLAAYELGELDEIMEVGTITRPGRAAALLHFMDDSDGGLKPVKAAVAAQDPVAFAQAYAAEIGKCNGCHASQKKNGKPFSFIQWQLPPVPPQHLNLTGVAIPAAPPVPAP